MGRLERTRNRIVNEAFPELSGVPIRTRWQNLRHRYLASTLNKKKFAIDVDNELRKSPDDILEGGMAHELAHIAITYGMGIAQRVLDLKLYKHSKKYRAWDERRTDRMVIDRGYGKQLHSFTVFRNEQRSVRGRPDKEDGLTVEEIKTLLEQQQGQ